MAVKQYQYTSRNHKEHELLALLKHSLKFIKKLIYTNVQHNKTTIYHIWFKESQPKINPEAYQIVKNLTCVFYFGEMERNTFIFAQKITPFMDGVIRNNKVPGRHFFFCTLE